MDKETIQCSRSCANADENIYPIKHPFQNVDKLSLNNEKYTRHYQFEG